MTDNTTNDQLIFITGFSTTGKSASLRNIRNQQDWAYLNTEAGKRLPFQNGFQTFRISEPYQVWEAFDHAIQNNAFPGGIIIDSATFLLDMFESQYVVGAANGQKAWGDFQQFWKILMQQKVVEYAKPVIITAHLKDVYDEKSLSMKTHVPVKGALANNGLESYFSTVVSTKQIPVDQLEPYQSEILTISDEDRELGFKYVFQTRPTKTTVGERIRSPMGMFSKEQTFMDNDAQVLLDHLHRFYKA